MESLIGLVNRIQRACTVLGDHGGADGAALPTLWEALPSVAVVGGQVPVLFLLLLLVDPIPLLLSRCSLDRKWACSWFDLDIRVRGNPRCWRASWGATSSPVDLVWTICSWLLDALILFRLLFLFPSSSLSLVIGILAGIVTRRPLVLQLHKTDEGQQEYAEFLHLPKRRFSDFCTLTRIYNLHKIFFFFLLNFFFFFCGDCKFWLSRHSFKLLVEFTMICF